MRRLIGQGLYVEFERMYAAHQNEAGGIPQKPHVHTTRTQLRRTMIGYVHDNVKDLEWIKASLFLSKFPAGSGG